MSDKEFCFKTLINSCLINVATAKITEYMLKMIDSGSENNIIMQINKIKSNIMLFITGIITFIRNYLITIYGCKYHFLCYTTVFISVIFIIIIITFIRFLIKTNNKKDRSDDISDKEIISEIISENCDDDSDN